MTKETFKVKGLEPESFTVKGLEQEAFEIKGLEPESFEVKGLEPVAEPEEPKQDWSLGKWFSDLGNEKLGTVKLPKFVGSPVPPMITDPNFELTYEAPAQVANKLPFVGSALEATRFASVWLAAKAVNEGRAIESDYETLRKFNDEMQYWDDKEKTFGYKVMEVAGQLPAFATEFAATGGSYSGVKASIEAGIKKALGHQVKKKAGRIAAGTAARVAGVTAHTLANPQMTASIGARNLVYKKVEPLITKAAEAAPKTDEEWRAEIDKSFAEFDDEWIPSMLRALPDAMIEFGSERTGRALGEGLKYLGKLPVGKQVTAFKEALINKVLHRVSDKGVDSLAKFKDRIGWHGVIEEVFEEKVAAVTREIAAKPGLVDKLEEESPAMFRMVTGEGGRAEALMEFLEETAVEAVAFALPGAGMATAGYARDFASRDKGEAKTPRSTRVVIRNIERGLNHPTLNEESLDNIVQLISKHPQIKGTTEGERLLRIATRRGRNIFERGPLIAPVPMTSAGKPVSQAAFHLGQKVKTPQGEGMIVGRNHNPGTNLIDITVKVGGERITMPAQELHDFMHKPTEGAQQPDPGQIPSIRQQFNMPQQGVFPSELVPTPAQATERASDVERAVQQFEAERARRAARHGSLPPEGGQGGLLSQPRSELVPTPAQATERASDFMPGDKVKVAVGKRGKAKDAIVLEAVPDPEGKITHYKVRIGDGIDVLPAKSLSKPTPRKSSGFKVDPAKSLENAVIYEGGINPALIKQEGLQGEWDRIPAGRRRRIARHDAKSTIGEIVERLRDHGYDVDGSNLLYFLADDAVAKRGTGYTNGKNDEFDQLLAEYERLRQERDEYAAKLDQQRLDSMIEQEPGSVRELSDEELDEVLAQMDSGTVSEGAADYHRNVKTPIARKMIDGEEYFLMPYPELGRGAVVWVKAKPGQTKQPTESQRVEEQRSLYGAEDFTLTAKKAESGKKGKLTVEQAKRQFEAEKARRTITQGTLLTTETSTPLFTQGSQPAGAKAEASLKEGSGSTETVTAQGQQEEKPERFAYGRNISPEQKKKLLDNMGDVYRDNNLKKDEVKYVTRNDDPVYGYPHRPDLFLTSDITGAKIRYYITLPGGKVAHPSELFPDVGQVQIDAIILQQKAVERERKAVEKEKLARVATGRNDANYRYTRTGRKLPGSYFAENDKSEVVRVDGTDQADVEFYESRGFKQVSAPVKASADKGAEATERETKAAAAEQAKRAEELDRQLHEEQTPDPGTPATDLQPIESFATELADSQQRQRDQARGELQQRILQAPETRTRKREQLGLSKPKDARAQGPLFGKEDEEPGLFSEPTARYDTIDNLIDSALLKEVQKPYEPETPSIREVLRSIERPLAGVSKVQSGRPVRMGGRSGVSLLGLGIAPNVRKGEWVESRGKRVRTIEDIVSIGRLHRNPYYEILHSIYILPSGEIAAHHAISSRLPRLSAAHKKLPRDTYRDVNKRIGRIAKKYGVNPEEVQFVLLHNHPTGDVKVSDADAVTTVDFARNIPQFVGHIVIDHETYSLINRVGAKKEYLTLENKIPDTWEQPVIPHKGLDWILSSGPKLAAWGKRMVHPSGATVTVPYMKNYRVIAIESVPVKLFIRPKEFADWVRGRSREYGAKEFAAYYSNPNSPELSGIVNDKIRQYVAGDLMIDGYVEGMTIGETRTFEPGHRYGMLGLDDKQFNNATTSLREPVKEYGDDAPKDSGDLIATHNLSEKNLLHAVRMGGIPVPSLAITKKNQAITGFGEITLVGSKDLVDPKGYAKAKVFGSDIYSPRYPSVSYSISPKDSDKILKRLVPSLQKADPAKKFHNISAYSLIEEIKDKGPHEAIRNSNEAYVAYLHETKGFVNSAEEYAPRPPYEDGTDPAFDKWINDLMDGLDLKPVERILQGFTNAGNRRYVPHTLDRVVAILKKGLRGGEGFNYGVGSLRSKFTPQFKSISHIRNNKGRLATDEEFKKVKEEIDAELFKIVDALGPYSDRGNEFGFADTVIAIMEDSPRLGVGGALKSYGIEGVPDEVLRNIREFIGKLKNLPTEYFEAKIPRGVGIQEFSGAVIPKGAGKDVRDILQSAGVKVVEYENEADRRRAVQEFAETLNMERGGIVFDDIKPYGDLTDSPAFRKWFGESKVVDADGKPMVVYHWTDAEFDEFDLAASGGMIHFGTKRAAWDRAGGAAGIAYEIENENDGYWVFADSGPMAGNGQGPFGSQAEAKAFIKKQPKRIEPMGVFLKIENPLRVPDFGVWTVDAVRTYLSNEGIITDKEADAVWAAWNKSDAEAYKELGRVLAKHGYDGFVYENEQEDAGSDSYVAISPTQIKSAIGNDGTFDPDNPSIVREDSSLYGPMSVESFADANAQAEVDRRAKFARDAVERVIAGKGSWSEKRRALGLEGTALNRFPNVPIGPKEIDAAVLRELRDTIRQTGLTPTGMKQEKAPPKPKNGSFVWEPAAAYHGSPYRFDKFSTSKIGTGEGAQTYGHGLYFASKREVAEHYKRKLSDRDDSPGTAADWVRRHGSKENAIIAAKEQFQKELEHFKNHPDELAEIERIYPEIIHKIESYKRGHLYEVELAPEEDEYLLWDKPLSEQSEKVRTALGGDAKIDALFNTPARRKAGVKVAQMAPWEDMDSLPGEGLYKILSQDMGESRSDNGWSSVVVSRDDRMANDRAASEYLHSLGIRGIKYLDGSSRKKGEGDYNYVVFSDSDVTINSVAEERAPYGADKEDSPKDLEAELNERYARLLAMNRADRRTWRGTIKSLYDDETPGAWQKPIYWIRSADNVLAKNEKTAPVERSIKKAAREKKQEMQRYNDRATEIIKAAGIKRHSEEDDMVRDLLDSAFTGLTPERLREDRSYQGDKEAAILAAEQLRNELFEPIISDIRSDQKLVEIIGKRGYIRGYFPHFWQQMEKKYGAKDAAIIAKHILPEGFVSRFLKERESNYWLNNVSIYDVVPAYIQSTMRTKHDIPAYNESLKIIETLPEDSPIREFADWYVRNYMGINTDKYLGIVPRNHPIVKLSRWIAQRHYDATIGLNLMTWGVNTLQTVSNTIPEIGVKYSAAGIKALSTKEGREKFHDAGLLFDYPGIESGVMGEGLYQKIMHGGMSGAEYLNRGIAYLGGLAEARDMGLIGQAAEQHAMDVVEKTQFTYSKESAIQALDALTPDAKVLMTFPMKELEFFSGLVRDAYNGGSHEKMKLVRFMLINFGIGAAGKIAGVELWDWLIGLMDMIPGIPRSWQLAADFKKWLWRVMDGQVKPGDIPEDILVGLYKAFGPAAVQLRRMGRQLGITEDKKKKKAS